jgi:hypothetical protein
MQFREDDILELLDICRTTDKCSVKLIRKLEDYLEQYSCDEQSLARTYPPFPF